MTDEKLDNPLDPEQERVKEHMRSISSAARVSLAGSLCSKEQEEYERRLSEASDPATDKPA